MRNGTTNTKESLKLKHSRFKSVQSILHRQKKWVVLATEPHVKQLTVQGDGAQAHTFHTESTARCSRQRSYSLEEGAGKAAEKCCMEEEEAAGGALARTFPGPRQGMAWAKARKQGFGHRLQGRPDANSNPESGA